MRIAQLTPGTGSFHCGSCLRDDALVRALRAEGHDAVLVPLYMPLVTDEPRVASDAPILFGGINVYLQSMSALFRATPAFVDRLWDTAPLLRLAAAQAGMTRPEELGPLTLSMLRGEHGDQVKELDRLVDWLDRHGPFDVVCLSNALLLGMARRIREHLRVPVACTLQGEDTFLDALPEPFRWASWEEVAVRAREIDALIPVSRWYASKMSRRLDLPADRVHAVLNGIPLDGWLEAAPAAPTIGYLARMCRDKGLDVLVEAFARLAPRKPELRLRIAGAMIGLDVPYVEALQRRIREEGLEARVDFLPNLDLAEKRRFLASLSVLCVPVRYDESFGLYVLEALASRVPVVETACGGLPELVADTEGGVIVPPEDPAALAKALDSLLADEPRRLALARRGRERVRESYDVHRAARDVVRVFERIARAPATREPST